MRKKRYRHRDKLKLIHNCLKHYRKFEKSLQIMDHKLTKLYIKQRLNNLYGKSVYFGDVLYNDTDSIIYSDFNKKQEI